MKPHNLKLPPTNALFFNRETSAKSMIAQVLSFPEGVYVFCKDSPFHPEDYPTGDQPGDIGVLELDNYKYQIVDTRTFISDSLTGEVVRPESKSILRKGVSEGRYFLHTGHFILDDDISPRITDLEVGKTCSLLVNQNARNQLSKLHTATHIMSFGLSEILKGFWVKEITEFDGLGNPDFDFYAIQSSKIFLDKVIDEYRIGKSLKKVGFDVNKFNEQNFEDFSAQLSEQCNKLKNDNITSSILMEGNSIILGERRYWCTVLNQIKVTIPCGGTHVERLSELGDFKISVSYSKEEGKLSITTTLV